MKTVLLSRLLLPTAGWLIGCAESDECNAPVTIERVYPNNNPTAGPVLIKGTGFSSNTEVRFGNEKAEIAEYSSTYISTKVPSGLSGLTKLTVANGGECVATTNFEIRGSTIFNLPGSPPVYLIPPPGMAFPVTVRLAATIYLRNAYDANHYLYIGCCYSPQSTNFSGYESFGSQYTTSDVQGTQEVGYNKLTIRIDRPAPFTDEELVGGFYTKTMIVDGQPSTNNYFIVFSTLTGRQYVFRDR